MPARRFIISLLAVLVLAVPAAGCGQESTEDSGKASADRAAEAKGEKKEGKEKGPAEDAAASGDPAKLSGVSTPEIQKIFARKKPKVEVPGGDAPAELETEDLTPGTGNAVKKGDQIAVNYVGVKFSDGKQFDASFGKPQPFIFQLGQGMVIPGWDKGLEGAKVGTRRRLVIPAELAYGKEGSPPKIGPDEPLVFDIDVIAILPAGAAAG